MRLGLAVGGIVLLGLVVVVAVALLWLGLRRHGDRRRAEHDEEANRAAEQVRETIPAQAERERRDIVSLAALLAEHCWLDLATSWLPRVGDVNDPVALGVHPASALEDLDGATEKSTEASVPGPPARVPVYVPRDLDAKLDAALAAALTRGGLVLVRGDSTVGKSRAAFEAMRRLPGDLWLLVPYHLGSLRALLDGGVELRDVVVWLDDLERYLDAGGLEVELLPRLVGEGDRRVVVLATMRAREYNARRLGRERDHAGPERNVLRAGQELLDQAVDLELPRRFSATEQQRAAERVWDPRIADALAHAGRYGVAEYLAVGPRLWRRWQNARAVDSSDHEGAGAAIVTAALDCRRAGLSRPVSMEALRGLYRDPAYLDPSVGGRLDRATFEQGLAWATEPERGAGALLRPQEGGYMVSDHLLDIVQAYPDAPPVPPSVWERVLRDLHADNALAIAAYQADERQVAERAWQAAARADDHDAENRLGVLLQERGDFQEAERWWRRAANAGHQVATRALERLRRS